MSNNPKSVLLHATGIRKSFFKGHQEVPVLRGVDIEIHQGELTAIMGASGAGKSTLLHILGTLEPPTAGKVFFGDTRRDLSRYSEGELSVFRNKTLGFIFQFHYLLPEFTAVENVMMPALIAGHGKKPAAAQAEELLKFVGLGERLQHRPSELSGGEQQRVAVARAVILRPKLLLADEVTGNLDSENGQVVMDLLINLNAATGVAVLLVTHDLQRAKRMHRVLEMRDGKLMGQEMPIQLTQPG